MTADRILEQQVRRVLDSVDRELRRLGRTMETLEEQKHELVDLLPAIRESGRSVACGRPRKQSLKSISQRGATTYPIVGLQLRSLPTGGAILTISKKALGASAPVERALSLTRTTAQTLSVLADQPTGDDGFPTAMTVQELADRLSETGTPVRRGAASERVTRLREAFENGGLNPELIDRSNGEVRPSVDTQKRQLIDT